MRKERSKLGRRGATAVFVAVALAALLGMVALAVDVGMLIKVRADAQRTADAAALAGAQEFLNATPAVAKGPAADMAIAYAARNYVGWQYPDTSGKIFMDSGNNRIVNSPEAYVQVLPDQQKVRVYIRRNTTATWFGHMLGIDFVPISVKAAAQAVNAGSGKCVKPFALPDMWHDPNDDINQPNELQDYNSKQGRQSPEDWSYDPTDTYYSGYDPLNPPVDSSGNQVTAPPGPYNTGNVWGTGWGSSWRNNSAFTADPNTYYVNDFGRPMMIKVTNPQTSPNPGFFYAWTMPYDSANPQAYCNANGCATPNNGAQWYKWNISHCNPVGVNLVTQEYLDKTGNMVGPTSQGIDSLIAQDPNACWRPEPVTAPPGGVVGGQYMGGEVGKLDASGGCTLPYDAAHSDAWENSPRVAIVPLFDPAQLQSGRTSLTFNNLAKIFIEGQTTAHDAVIARFMGFYLSTGPQAPSTGSLIRRLQLVE